MTSFRKILCFALLGVAAASSAKTSLYGIRFTGELIRFNPDTGESVVVGPTGLAGPNALALSPTGILYAANFTLPRRFSSIDMGTGAATDIVASGFADIRDMAFVGPTLYAIRDGGGAANDVLVTIAPDTGVVTTVGTMSRSGFQALCAFGSALFAWDTSTGLHTVNLGTGATTDVGPEAGFNLQGLGFTSDGIMYGADTGGNVRRINHVTGASSIVSSIGGDVRAIGPMPHSYRVLLGRANTAGDQLFRILDTGTMQTLTLPTLGGLVDSGTGLSNGLTRVTSGVTLAALDPGNGGISILNGAMGRAYEGLAYDGSLMYGVSDQGNSVLFRIDTNTGSSIPMGSTGFTNVQGLSFVGTQLYGWDTVAGLIRISTGTGAGTDVNVGIPGNLNIRSLETMPDGTLLGFGDRVYVMNTATGSFQPRGGDWGGQMMASASLVTDDAQFLAVSGAGQGFRVTRTGALSATGWSTGLANWAGLKYGDDGLVYMSNRATNRLLTLNPSTGSTSVIMATPAVEQGLGWFRPSLIAPDANEIEQGGDLYLAKNNQLLRRNTVTNTWDVVQATGYQPVGDIATLPSGRLFHGAFGANWFRLDAPWLAGFDLNALSADNNGLECLPDGTLFGTKGTGVSGEWYVIDPITGSVAASAMGTVIKGISYVGTRLTGLLTLGDYVGDARTQTVTIEYRHRGSSEPVETRKVKLGLDQSFTVACFQRGGYDVTVKGTHWLRKKLSPALVANGLALGFGTLTNGDVDDDNEIGIGDYSGLSTAFNSIPGDPNWNPNADLNGDDSVDIADYAILSANYGEVGDD
ncbi:MAG: hypothetical protein K1X67_22515 [Fimbriimonadaceae bacterium]|nr:hypothetical protein [Fimbriimonadaceae bacterium]